MANPSPTPKKPAPVLARRSSQTSWPTLIIGGSLLAAAGWFIWQANQKPPEVIVIKEAPKATETPKAEEPEKKPAAVVEAKPVAPVVEVWLSKTDSIVARLRLGGHPVTKVETPKR